MAPPASPQRMRYPRAPFAQTVLMTAPRGDGQVMPSRATAAYSEQLRVIENKYVIYIVFLSTPPIFTSGLVPMFTKAWYDFD